MSKASLVKSGPRTWRVATANGIEIAVLQSRGDVYAIVRRIPGCVINSVQAYEYVPGVHTTRDPSPLTSR